ncbi:MAG: AMP-binding protein [Archaeoglobaceae archaeon]
MTETSHSVEMSFSDFIMKKIENNSKKVAIVFNNNKIKYKRLERDINKFANALTTLNLNKGIIALCLLNTPHFVVSYLGALRAGAKVCVIDPTVTAYEFSSVLNEVSPEALVLQNTLLRNFGEIETQNCKKIILADVNEYSAIYSRKLKLCNYEANLPEEIEVLKYGKILKKESSEFAAPSIDLNDDAVIIYQSDTSDKVKGVVFSHYNLKCQIESLKVIFKDLLEEKAVITVFLPLSNIFSKLITLTCLWYGGTLILIPFLDYPQILYLTEKHNANIFYGTPLNYREMTLMYREFVKCVDWRRMKAIFSIGPYLNRKIAYIWKSITNTNLSTIYGIIEAGITHVKVGNGKKMEHRACGIPVPNLEAKILDHSTLKFLPPGKEGELVISGPQIMRGYWPSSERKDNFVLIEGKKWLKTGVMGYMDNEDCFYYLCRIEDLIRNGEVEIIPSEIEDVINEHPLIIESVVTKEDRGIVAYAVPLSKDITEKELLMFLQPKLPKSKLPEIIEFRTELPKNEIGEILRKEIKEMEVL